jgi:hypothetical protein
MMSTDNPAVLLPECVLEISLQNLMKMSRTANGIVDVSASSTKKDVMLVSDGDEAARKANENFISAIEYCYANRKKKFADSAALRNFVESVGAKINQGIVKSGSLLRSGEDSLKYCYTRLQYMEEELDWFYENLLALISDPNTDPVYLAAFMEYYVNLRIHIFADGCGKSSIALAAWMFMLRDRLPVSYDSRDSYYAHGPTGVYRCGSREDREDFDNFLAYYRTLPSNDSFRNGFAQEENACLNTV